MGSFLYPRTITITRPSADTSYGAQPYSGLQASNESVVAEGLAAHIQIDNRMPPPLAKLPGDALSTPVFRIIFKAASGLTRTGDVITDDLGSRYQVISADWGPLVTTCRAQLLQT